MFVRKQVILIIILIVALSVQLFLFANRDVFHIDELFSFALANGENGIYLYHLAEEINDKALSGEIFRRYLTQGDNTSFSLMWQNISGDNHMPLYFLLLRGVNCFFNPFVFTPIPGVMFYVCCWFLFINYQKKFLKMIKLLL